eukprot:4821931-Pleurochrysis_carterae.AAC.1
MLTDYRRQIRSRDAVLSLASCSQADATQNEQVGARRHHPGGLRPCHLGHARARANASDLFTPAKMREVPLYSYTVVYPPYPFMCGYEWPSRVRTS